MNALTAYAISWLESNTDTKANAEKAISRWRLDSRSKNRAPVGWVGGQLRNTLPKDLDDALNEVDNEDPTGDIGAHFYPETPAITTGERFFTLRIDLDRLALYAPGTRIQDVLALLAEDNLTINSEHVGYAWTKNAANVGSYTYTTEEV